MSDISNMSDINLVALSVKEENKHNQVVFHLSYFPLVKYYNWPNFNHITSKKPVTITILINSRLAFKQNVYEKDESGNYSTYLTEELKTYKHNKMVIDISVMIIEPIVFFDRKMFKNRYFILNDFPIIAKAVSWKYTRSTIPFIITVLENSNLLFTQIIATPDQDGFYGARLVKPVGNSHSKKITIDVSELNNYCEFAYVDFF